MVGDGITQTYKHGTSNVKTSLCKLFGDSAAECDSEYGDGAASGGAANGALWEKKDEAAAHDGGEARRRNAGERAAEHAGSGGT